MQLREHTFQVVDLRQIVDDDACYRESGMDRRLLESRPEIEAFESAEGSLDAHTMRSSGISSS